MLPLATVIGELNAKRKRTRTGTLVRGSAPVSHRLRELSAAVLTAARASSAAINNNKELSIAYIGEGTAMEDAIFKGLGIKRYAIKAGKLRRYASLKNIVDAVKIPVGFMQSLKIITEFKPDIVFSKGGYVAVPVCYAAWVKGVPVVIHESDVIPGLATRLTARIAEKICLGWEETKYAIPAAWNGKTHITGIPVRKDIARGAAARARKTTGFAKNLPVTLIMGGSLGAAHINETAREALTELLKKTQIIHITGTGKKLSAGTVAPALRSRYFQTEFITKELPDFYKIADLAVSRAGAGTCAELDILGKPNILIPLGRDASRGDQIANASIMRRKGSVIIPDATLTAKTLTTAIEKLLKTPPKKIRKKSIHAAATSKIAAIIGGHQFQK